MMIYKWVSGFVSPYSRRSTELAQSNLYFGNTCSNELALEIMHDFDVTTISLSSLRLCTLPRNWVADLLFLGLEYVLFESIHRFARRRMLIRESLSGEGASWSKKSWW